MTDPLKNPPENKPKKHRVISLFSEEIRAGLNLGNTCEITLRFSEFADFWRLSPVPARFALQAESRELLPAERVKRCLRCRTDKDAPVDVWHIPVRQAACYGNLQTCGSVWNCPVCAAKIANRRREELSEAVAIWQKQGNGVLLATFTLQHTVDDSCADVLAGVVQAFSRFWQDRRGQDIRRDYAIVGRVRGLETTYTLTNGWHVHFHVLLFVQGMLSPARVGSLREECSAHWQAVLKRHQRYADSIHGVTVKDARRDIAEYIAKYDSDDMAEAVTKVKSWTESHEVAMGVIKRKTTELGGFTPTQLLALSLCQDEIAGLLFVEYAKAFKGKSQLHWSRGLRKLLGMSKELTDEEIAARRDEKASILAKLNSSHWKCILANDARGELLAAAANGNPDELRGFLQSLGLDDVWLNDGEISESINL